MRDTPRSMADAQITYPHDLSEMIGWVEAQTPPGGRVLEIGCGDGALVRGLADRISIVGVDPIARTAAGIRPTSFEELEDDAFDVIFASVALHHLHDPERGSEALRRLSKPGTIMLVREFDRELVADEPTLRWWHHQRLAREVVDPEPEKTPISASFEEFRERWWSEMERHVHPWSAVERMLAAAGFEQARRVSAPYLFRWGLGEHLRPAEEHLIRERRIKEVGIRWTGVRP